MSARTRDPSEDSDGGIPWLRVFAEGGVIVLSILLALAADAWWQDRQEREIERLYLVRLHDELQEGRAVIESTRARQLRTLAAMDTLMAFESGGRVVAGPEIAPTVLNAASYEVNPYSILFDQTYEEMLATGALGLVRDPSIREAITGYFRIAYTSSAVVDESTRSGYRSWATRVRQAMGTQARSWFSREPSRLQEIALALEPSDDQEERILALVGSDNGWADDLRLARSRIEGIDIMLGDLLQATNSLIRVLRVEVGIEP